MAHEPYYYLHPETRNLEIVSRSVGETCSLKNNPNCYPVSESSYNATCCSAGEACGILQGGCQSDEDCFDNLECSFDNCGLNINGTRCCQAPGRKPGLLF